MIPLLMFLLCGSAKSCEVHVRPDGARCIEVDSPWSRNDTWSLWIHYCEERGK